ncbi:MAG: hypothetical protein LBC31_08930 [Treponema sp.]|jgi:hypothetical protein|nr:hypothetical protein [Treponema sp.]
MDITEIQDELLRLEYPNLLPDHDPDIERYYYLRSIGQARDAMTIYQNRLKIRYPDDNFRTWLLRSYRSHDPAFRGLLAKGYRLLAVRSLERVKNIILYIAERAESYNEKDVYSTIKTAEEILQFLPSERYEAVAGMERFLRYASVLDLKVPSIAKAVELVRAYLTDSLAVVEEERKRRSEALSRMEEAERQRLVQADWDSYYYQKKYGVHAPLIDLSAVVFSQADLNRIEVPPFPRIEDQILGYCVKYWNLVDDPAFERILFLYSRKYGKKNYEVFMSIRRGRQAKHRDDEILASIMSVLVTGYYYSIQGDIYLQRNWNTIKHILTNQGPPKALPAPPSSSAPEASPKAIAAAAGARANVKTRAKAAAQQTGVKRTKDAAQQQRALQQKARGKAAGERPLREPASRLVPRAKPKTAPRIAPPPAKPKSRPAVAVAKPAARAAEQAPAKPPKVPYKLQPAREPKTTIVAPQALQKPPAPRPGLKPAVPVRAAAPRPAAPKKTPKPERFSAGPLPAPAGRPIPAPPPRPAAVVPPPRPAQPPKPAAAASPPRPAPAPKPAAAASPPRPAPAPKPAAASPPRPAPLPKPAAAASPPRPAQPPKPAAAASPPRPAPPPKPAAASSLPSKPLASAPPVQPGGYRPAPYVSASSPPNRPKSRVFTTRTLEKAKGSVSDRLKQLSGRSYDVYEDRFLSKARTVIRKVLGTGRGLFFNLPEEAEDLIYNFLRDHYSDPYMDWEDSAERRNLASMGFELPSLNPVIDECYKLL